MRSCSEVYSPGLASPEGHSTRASPHLKIEYVQMFAERHEILGCYDFFVLFSSNRTTSPAAVGFVAPLLLVPFCGIPLSNGARSSTAVYFLASLFIVLLLPVGGVPPCPPPSRRRRHLEHLLLNNERNPPTAVDFPAFLLLVLLLPGGGSFLVLLGGGDLHRSLKCFFLPPPGLCFIISLPIPRRTNYLL